MEEKEILKINESGWNKLIQGGKSFSNTSLPEYGPFMDNEEKFQIFKDVEGKSVLELGCADGNSLKYLLNNGAEEVYGIDISREQIEKAKLNVPTGKFYVSDMTSNPGVPLDYFDYCLSLYSIGYTSNLDKTFEQVTKYLKSGGTFVYSWTHPFYNCLSLEGDSILIKHSYNDEGIKNIFKGEDMVEMVQYNFKISTIINSMVNHGLEVKRIIEDEPTKDNHIVRNGTAYWDSRLVSVAPTTLIIVAVKK